MYFPGIKKKKQHQVSGWKKIFALLNTDYESFVDIFLLNKSLLQMKTTSTLHAGKIERLRELKKLYMYKNTVRLC